MAMNHEPSSRDFPSPRPNDGTRSAAGGSSDQHGSPGAAEGRQDASPADASAGAVTQARPVPLPYLAQPTPLRLVTGPPGPPVLSVSGTMSLLVGVLMLYMLAGVFLASYLSDGDLQHGLMENQMILIIVQWAIFLIIPLLTLLVAGADLRTVYAWHPPRGDLLVLTISMAVCLAGLVQYAGSLAMPYLEPFYDRLLEGWMPNTAERFQEVTGLLEANTVAELIGVLLVAALTPAICEEHFFRGVIQSSLDKHIPKGVAVLTVAVIFAAYHFEPVSFPALLMIGFFVGLLTSRSECIVYACIVHFTNNGLSVLLHNWSIRNIGELEPGVGSVNSLPLYLFGGLLGIAAFLSRTPRRFGGRWPKTEPVIHPIGSTADLSATAASPSEENPSATHGVVFRPGRWHRGSLWLSRRWRLAAVAALSCSVFGIWLDIEDLRAMAAQSDRRPTDETIEEMLPPDEPPYVLPEGEEEPGPDVIYIRALPPTDGGRGHSSTSIRATLQYTPGAPGPSTIVAPDLLPISRSPTSTSYAPGLAR